MESRAFSRLLRLMQHYNSNLQQQQQHAVVHKHFQPKLAAAEQMQERVHRHVQATSYSSSSKARDEFLSQISKLGTGDEHGSDDAAPGGSAGSEEAQSSDELADVRWKRLLAHQRAGPRVLSPLEMRSKSKTMVTYVTKHEALSEETLQAGILLVAHPRADIRRKYISRICEAAVARNLLVYSITPSGSVGVDTPGVFKLYSHPTLSRRAILSAMLRHGANVLVFGVISTRDDMQQLQDAVYTGYHCVVFEIDRFCWAEVFGESANDVISRLEAIGIDTSMLPANLRIVVPDED